MRHSLFALLLCVCGCWQNNDALSDRLAERDRQLAEVMAFADTLSDQRRALEDLEHEVNSGLAEVPGAREAVAVLETTPLVPATLPTPMPPLPPVGVLEGSSGARRRALILDSENRLAQLGKVLGSVYARQPEKKRLKQKLEIINRLRGQQDAGR